jgi:solute carrier family 50 protein (sugar transporter)
MSPHEAAVLAFRVLAGCSYLVMLSSPSLNIYRVYKAKSVGVHSIFPLVALLANSHLWYAVRNLVQCNLSKLTAFVFRMMYGYLAEIYFPVFSCFIVGDFAAVIYLTVYYRYSSNREYVVRSIATVLAIISGFSAYAIVGGLGYTNQTRHEVSTVLGFFSAAASVCLYCAPMERLIMVLKHKSAVFINLPMVRAGYMNNMIWLTFGSLIGNWFMISINIFFFTMNSITLVVYHLYDPKTHPLRDGWDATPSKISKADEAQIQVSVDLTSEIKALETKDRPALERPTLRQEINVAQVVPAVAD